MKPERPRTLIYLASLGAAVYRCMTELLVRSLRGPGNYRGPILVFTNNGFQSGDGATDVISLSADLDHFAIFETKARAAESIRAEDFDKLLFMDSDMLAIDDVAPLFEHSDAAVCGMVEKPWSRMSDPSCGECLTAAERRRARRRWGINTGLLCTPAPIFRETMALWAEEFRRRYTQDTCWMDQSPFNALVLNGRVRFRAYPRYWIDMPPVYRAGGGRFRVRPQTRVLHFCNGWKQQSVDEMEVLLGALELGETGCGSGADRWSSSDGSNGSSAAREHN
jgi:hypothetical protein